MSKQPKIQSLREYPGFFENIGRPDCIQQLATFIETPGIKGTFMEGAVREFLPTEGALLSPFWRNLAQRLSGVMDTYRFEVIEVQEYPMEFHVHNLFCPKVKDATASLTVGSEEGSTGSCRFEILGVGGGPEHMLTTEISDRFTTKGESIAIYYTFKTIWEKCIIHRDDQQTTFTRLMKIDDTFCETSIKPLDPGKFDVHRYAVKKQEQVDLSSIGSSVTKSFTVKKGLKWEASTEIKVYGIKMGPKYSASMQWTNSYELNLPPGHRHEVTRFNDVPWIWWGIQE